MTDLNLNIRLRAVAGGVVGAIRSIRSNLAVMEREDAGRHRRVMARIDGVVGGYRRIGGAIRSAVTAGAGLTGLFLGAGLVGIVRTTAQFEKYEAVLTGLEGSQAKAQASMRWVTNFAATTPYEIDQVMEAFVRLRAYGIDPTDGTLRILGDTASTMGKDVMDAVEMMADAQSGEFERLKEFGIKARQDGNRVTFSWVENGKTIERSTAKSGAEITRTLLGIMGPKNAGAMERQSKTLGGIWSGLMDYITSFKVMIAEAGLGDFMRAELGGLMAELQTPEGQARAKALAKDISEALVDGIQAIREALAGIDVKEFIGGLVSIVTFLPKVITFFGGFSNLITELGSLAIGKIGLDLGILAVTLGGLAGIAAGPIIFVVAIVTALALAAWMIYRNWGGIKRFFGGIWSGIVAAWNGAPAWFGGLWDRLKPIFAAGALALWNILPPWLRVLLRGGAFVLRVVGQGLGAAAAATGATAPAGTAQRLARPGVQPGRGGPPQQLNVAVTHHSDGRPASVAVTSPSPTVRMQPGRGGPPRGAVRPQR